MEKGSKGLKLAIKIFVVFMIIEIMVFGFILYRDYKNDGEMLNKLTSFTRGERVVEVDESTLLTSDKNTLQLSVRIEVDQAKKKFEENGYKIKDDLVRYVSSNKGMDAGSFYEGYKKHLSERLEKDDIELKEVYILSYYLHDI